MPAMLLGMAAYLAEDRERALALLREALDGFEARGMTMHANAVRMRLAPLVAARSPLEARAYAVAVDAWVREQGVVNADAFFEMLAPVGEDVLPPRIRAPLRAARREAASALMRRCENDAGRERRAAGSQRGG
jgi:hypothetical protein